MHQPTCPLCHAPILTSLCAACGWENGDRLAALDPYDEETGIGECTAMLLGALRPPAQPSRETLSFREAYAQRAFRPDPRPR